MPIEPLTCGSGPKGIRTPDLLAASQALYQLSYGPRGGLVYGTGMDVSLASFVVLLHVATAFLFVGGLIGRGIVLNRARRSTDLDEINTLLPIADRFEKIVVPGSAAVLAFGLLAMWAQDRPLFTDGAYWLLVSLALYLSLLPLVPLIFLPRGRVFEAALTDARHRGSVTPELTTAFHDPWVTFARTYELVVVAIVMSLMVLKPF